MRKILVLNKSWHPIGIVSLQKAMALLLSTNKFNVPKAKAIDPTDFTQHYWEDWSKLPIPFGEETLNSACNKFRIPLVILLTHYNKVPKRKIKFTKKTLWRRDNFECQYCGIKTKELTIDHIVPRSHGGTTHWDNCCAACAECNMKKANRTPKQAGMKFFHSDFIPTKPRYNFFKIDLLNHPLWKLFITEDIF